jgi:nucleotide-binding universal stress UspA family protein
MRRKWWRLASENGRCRLASMRESVVKDVLVHGTVRSGSALEHGIPYALTLAASQGAEVTVFLSEVEPRAAPFVTPDTMQGGIQSRVEAAAREDTGRIATLIQVRAGEQGVPCKVLISDAEVSAAGAQLARHARVSDLVVVSVYGALQYPRQELVQAVLFGTGRPLMLVPAHGRPFSVRTAMVAWDATPAANRALFDAMPLLATAAEVIVVTVLGDKDLQPEESGEEVCRVLSYRNIPARFEPIQEGAQDVGAMLLRAAARVQADLLVMGGFAHPREREFLVGSATRSLFRSGFPLPVLLSH